MSTAHKLVVLITPGVSESMKSKLQDVFDVVELVNVLDSKDAANLAVLKRPELGITFTKLHCWNLTQFDKCVFLDADVLVSLLIFYIYSHSVLFLLSGLFKKNDRNCRQMR